MSKIDRNSSSNDRIRRNFQRLSQLIATSTLGGSSFTVDPNGALSTGVAGTGVKVDGSTIIISGDKLAVKLANNSLAENAAGLRVNIASTNPGFGLDSTGFRIGNGDSSINFAGSTIAVFRSATTSALNVNSTNGLFVGVDGSTITVNGLNELTVIGSTISAPIIAGDTSIAVASSTGSTTIRVRDGSNGGITTTSTGIAVMLADGGGSTSLLNFDFTTQTLGANVGAIGGSGTTWYCSAGVIIPNGSQDDTAMTIQNAGTVTTKGARSNTGSQTASAMYVPTLAIGTNYTITMSMTPEAGMSVGTTAAIGVFLRTDKVSFTSGQGISVRVWTDRMWITDMTTGVIASTLVTLNTSSVYNLTVTVAGNLITAAINGSSCSATTSNYAANVGLGLWEANSLSFGKAYNFQVSQNSSTFYSGLHLGATGLGVLTSSTSGLLIGSTGVSINADGSTITVNSTGVLTASTAGTPLIAADQSIILGSSTGSTTIGVRLVSTGGLQVGAGGLSIKLINTTLATSASGIAVNIAAPGGLGVSSGLFVNGFRTSVGTPGSPAIANAWFDTTAVAFVCNFAPSPGLLGTVSANTAKWAAAQSVTASTSALTFATDQIPYNAAFLNIVGRAVLIRLHVTFNASAIANTFTFNIQLGSTVISSYTTAAVASGSLESVIETLVYTQTTGATGTVAASTKVVANAVATATSFTVSTVNLTSALTLQFTASATSINAGDSITIQTGTVCIQG